MKIMAAHIAVCPRCDCNEFECHLQIHLGFTQLNANSSIQEIRRFLVCWKRKNVDAKGIRQAFFSLYRILFAMKNTDMLTPSLRTVVPMGLSPGYSGPRCQ